MRSLVPQSLHNGKVLSYLDKAVMATRHRESGQQCLSNIAIDTITILLVCLMVLSLLLTR